MRVAIYIRVSSDEQVTNFSLEAQEKVCRQLAAARGWDVAAVFADPGVSAKDDKRPQFRRMIAEAKAGRFEAILTHKLDRFSRSIIDTLSYLRDLEKVGVSYTSATEQFDFTTPMGRVMLTMLAAFAELYLSNLSAETTKGKRTRAEAGYQNNATPFGYSKAKGKDIVAEVDPKTIGGYRLAVRLALEGQTDLQIAWAMNDANYRTTKGRRFSKDTIGAMLRSRFYLGEVCYRKNWYPGRHEATIELETWNKIQTMRAGRAVRPDHANITARAYPLTSVLYCSECGRGMRGASMRGYRYYRDTAKEHGIDCPQKNMVKAEILEKQIGDYLASFIIPEDWRTMVLKIIGQDVGEVERMEKDRRRLEAESDRAKHLFIAGDLTEGEYNHERARIKASLSNLVIPSLPDMGAAVELLTDFGKLWTEADDDERKRLIRALIVRAWVKGKEIVAVEPKAEMHYLLSVGQNTPLVGSAARNPRETTPVSIYTVGGL